MLQQLMMNMAEKIILRYMSMVIWKASQQSLGNSGATGNFAIGSVPGVRIYKWQPRHGAYMGHCSNSRSNSGNMLSDNALVDDGLLAD